jgi:ribonuclease-3
MKQEKLGRGLIVLANIAELQQSLGVSFKDLALLEQALIHSSYVNENHGLTLTSNERLEFLGDAVLGLIFAEKLYWDFPQFGEGKMTKLRAALVRQETLARMARTVRLGDYLYLGKGEGSSGGQGKPSNLAGALEAVIAAVFLDQGLAATREFILRLFNEELASAVTRGADADYKTQPQELTQARQQPPPVYQLIEAEGPAHDKRFTVEVKTGDTVLGKGVGKSKKAAEAEAAHSALRRLLPNFT